jgi:DNA-binding beta-propeller fold protein YncE
LDNVRQEIVAANTITRYGPTLNELISHDVYGYLRDVTVDQSDGAMWYTDFNTEQGLYKVNRDFNPVYSFTDSYFDDITSVSPSGNFWVDNRGDHTIERRDSDGDVKAVGNVTGVTPLVMYFNDESCWAIYGASYTVVKVNSSGAIVYENYADFAQPHDLDVDQSDGSVWVADTNNFEVVHLDSSGSELLRKANDWTPMVVAVDPSDSTVIVLYQPGEVGIKSASLGEIKAMYAEPEE